jgi:hypothetical protein
MDHEISRRDLLKSVVLAGALAPALGLIGEQSQAADLSPLDENDPAAKAFAFVTDASKAEAGANPTFRMGQRCAECSRYQGKPTDARAGCVIFAGRSVPADGWCKAWSQRSG